MAAKPVEEIVKALKEIIDKNGPNYLSDEPFQVCTELISFGNSDRKTGLNLCPVMEMGAMMDMSQSTGITDTDLYDSG